jgi:hypothetical protein
MKSYHWKIVDHSLSKGTWFNRWGVLLIGLIIAFIGMISTNDEHVLNEISDLKNRDYGFWIYNSGVILTMYSLVAIFLQPLFWFLFITLITYSDDDKEFYKKNVLNRMPRYGILFETPELEYHIPRFTARIVAIIMVSYAIFIFYFK